MPFDVTLIPGDGIGPEITEAAVKVPLIAARRGAHLKTAQRLAGRLFAEKPKAFRQRIGALWSARQ